MSKPRANDALLGKLHEALGADLLRRVQSGEATPQELNAAIKFLADNDIKAETVPESTLSKLAHALPTFNDDDDIGEEVVVN